MREKIFYLACLGFGAGVLWRSFLHTDIYTIFYLAILYVLFILFSTAILKKDWDIFISVFLIAFLVGILRFQLADTPPPKVFENYVGQSSSFSGAIVDEPEKSDTGEKLTVQITSEKTKTLAVIFLKSAGEYKYGDELQITGALEKPTNFMTDQGLEFDYVNYLRKDGIFYTMRDPQIEVLSSGHGNFIKRALFFVRRKFDLALSKSVPAPEGTVLAGIILGERYAFSQSLQTSFMNTGTVHIVTIGGYHVTLVAEWIMKLFSFLPQFAGIILGIVSIFLYVIVTGGAQTSIRAGIMATMALFATATGRTYTAGRALLLAAVVMILINPFVLAYDISFELSFIATIAIIFLSPRIEIYFRWIKWKWLRDIVSITSSMYVFALPFILYRIGNLSLIALPANILIVPLLPATMIAGFVTGFAGIISPVLSYIPGKIAYVLLYYQVSSIGTLSKLPFASLTILNFPLALVVIIYAIFIWIFWKGRNRKIPRVHTKVNFDRQFFILMTPLLLTLLSASFLYYQHFASNQNARNKIQDLLSVGSTVTFVPDERLETANCKINGPYPDHACTPGGIFPDATVENICVKGYTKTVRSVSTNLRKEVFAEYGIAYPQPRGAYEVDHFIPLALGGSNDIANLFPEAAKPIPGFHDKDVVEVFLQQEVCSGQASLAAAQRQIVADWLAVYNNISPEDKQAIIKKYSGDANP